MNDQLKVWSSFKEVQISDNTILSAIPVENIEAFMFAGDGAMGKAGEFKYFCKCNNALILYKGSIFTKGIDRAYVEKKIDELIHLRLWYYLPLGFGNFLYMKPNYKQDFDEILEESGKHKYKAHEEILKHLISLSIKKEYFSEEPNEKIKIEAILVTNSPYVKDQTETKVYDFSSQGYVIDGYDYDRCPWAKVLFYTWEKVDVNIDYHDVFGDLRYVKATITYHEKAKDGYSPKQESIDFYVSKENAGKLKVIYDERNESLIAKIRFVNAYYNSEIDIIANNFLQALDYEYLLMPRVVQALHNKYSHLFDSTLKVFELDTGNLTTKTVKQLAQSNRNLRETINNVSIIIDNFVEIICEKTGHSKDIAETIVWTAIQNTSKHYYAQRWLKECSLPLEKTNSNDDSIKRYIIDIVKIGEVDLSDNNILSMLTYYVMSISTELKTFPSTCLSIFRQIQAAKKQVKTISIRDQLLNTTARTKRTYSIDDVDIMSGGEFEEFLAYLFSKMGYATQLTKSSGDQGIDVIAEKSGIRIGIQAKCYGGSVGNSAVQEAVAGKRYYNCDKIIVITNNYFTTSAITLAKVNNVILWDREILKDKINEYLNK